jgi:hypothetical protein
MPGSCFGCLSVSCWGFGNSANDTLEVVGLSCCVLSGNGVAPSTQQKNGEILKMSTPGRPSVLAAAGSANIKLKLQMPTYWIVSLAGRHVLRSERQSKGEADS